MSKNVLDRCLKRKKANFYFYFLFSIFYSLLSVVPAVGFQMFVIRHRIEQPQNVFAFLRVEAV